MGKKQDILADYRKRIQELVDACMRTATYLAKPIKKETVDQLILMGVDEFKALEILETLNDFEMKCRKCGSTGRCVRCGTTIALL